MPFAKVEQLLRERIGLEAKSIGRSAIEAAVRERMARCKVADAEAYWHHLSTHQDEVAALIEEIVVPETWFFRERAAFDLLAQRLLTRSRTVERRLQVLCAPCATGEEAYSAAITLLEAGIPAPGFEVHALDLSERALEAARRAVYTSNSFRGARPGHEAYFRPTGDGLQVIDAARQRVQLSQGNLLDPSLCAGSSFDAIFCRNVLIYFDVAARSRAIMNLTRLLRDDGVLLVGHSEPLQFVEAGFRPVGEPGCFAFEKPLPSLRDPHARNSRTAPAPPRKRDGRAASARGSRSSGSSAAKPAPARAATAAKPKPKPGSREWLVEARGLADRGDLRAARERCEAYLKAEGPSAEGYCLLGVVKNAEGDQEGALDCFNRALYLDARHYESLIHLALISEHAGNSTAALQLRARAQRSAPKGRS